MGLRRSGRSCFGRKVGKWRKKKRVRLPLNEEEERSSRRGRRGGVEGRSQRFLRKVLRREEWRYLLLGRCVEGVGRWTRRRGDERERRRKGREEVVRRLGRRRKFVGAGRRGERRRFVESRIHRREWWEP